MFRVHVVSCSVKRLEHDFDRASRALLRPLGVALRVLQPPVRLAVCLMVSGHLSAHTRPF